MKPITMQDIADRCGVSRATVSFALRDDPRITQRRREQIRRVAEELGYRPNPLVNSLMTQLRSKKVAPSGNLIALLSFHPDTDTYKRFPLFRNLLESSQRRALELGYAFDLIDASSVNEHRSHIERILATRGTTGIIVPPVPPGIHAESINYANLAVVKFGYTCPALKAHRVAPYHSQAMRHTLRILKERGYRRISFIFHEESDFHTNYEFVAFASRHNYEASEEAIPLLPINQQTEPEVVKRHLLRYQPDIVVSDIPKVHEIIQRLGLRMPEDLEFCCLNTILTRDRTAGFHEDIPLLAEEMVNMLDNLIRQNRRGIPQKPVTLKVSGYWIDGPTMRPPPVGEAAMQSRAESKG